MRPGFSLPSLLTVLLVAPLLAQDGTESSANAVPASQRGSETAAADAEDAQQAGDARDAEDAEDGNLGAAESRANADEDVFVPTTEPTAPIEEVVFPVDI